MDRAEPRTPEGCCDDLNVNGEELKCQPDCVRWIQNDETALPCETGFYHKFESDPITGEPYGCPGFEAAKTNWQSALPNCQKEDYAPEGEPLYKITEQFAIDQQGWMNEFVPAFEKMVENGYHDNNNLEDGPKKWFSTNI